MISNVWETFLESWSLSRLSRPGGFGKDEETATKVRISEAVLKPM